MRPLILLALLPSIALADKTDDIVNEAMTKWGTPGVSVAVIQNGKVIKLKGYGYANLEHKVKVTPETIFQSGSVGKQFTASLVMKLVEDGKIGLDDSIRKHLPETQETWQKITIRNLLTHTAGLGDPYDRLDMRKDYTEAELLKILGEIPLQFQPGEKHSYSNSGYHVLGFLCSKVGGKFYGDQLVDRILKPAGMKTARIISEADIIMNRAAGYEIKNGKPYNQEWVAPKLNTTADGSMYVSLLDMVAWNSALDGDKVLSNQIKQQMWTPLRLNSGKTVDYGFGWSLAPVNGHKFVGHGGAWQGFRTAIQRYPNDNLAVIVLANSDSAQPDKLAQKIASAFVPDLIAKPLPPIADTVPDITALVKNFLDGDGANAHKLCDEGMKQAISVAEFDGFFKELRGNGARTKLELIQKAISDDSRRAVYRIQYGKSVQILTIVLDKNSLIIGLGIEDEG